MFCGTAVAQEPMTSGTVQASGRRITAIELAQIVPGTTVRNRAASGSMRQWSYEGDGTISGLRSDRRGQIGAPSGPFGGGTGKYRIDPAKEQLCHALTWTSHVYQRTGGVDLFCHSMFIIGDRVFGVSDRNVKISSAVVPEYFFPAEVVGKLLRASEVAPAQ
jgi:hypothetical protein